MNMTNRIPADCLGSNVSPVSLTQVILVPGETPDSYSGGPACPIPFPEYIQLLYEDALGRHCEVRPRRRMSLSLAQRCCVSAQGASRKALVYRKISRLETPFWGLSAVKLQLLKLSGQPFVVEFVHSFGGREESLCFTGAQTEDILAHRKPASDGQYKLGLGDLIYL